MDKQSPEDEDIVRWDLHITAEPTDIEGLIAERLAQELDRQLMAEYERGLDGTI